MHYIYFVNLYFCRKNIFYTCEYTVFLSMECSVVLPLVLELLSCLRSKKQVLR